MTFLNDIVFSVGAVSCVYIVINLLSTILGGLSTFVGSKNLRDYGSWAIVTGSTDGIGKSIAKELAKQKINLVLISRNEEKLSAVSKEITEKYNVEVKTTAVDMSVTTPADYTNIHNSYKDLDIGIIVNNVGLSYDHPEYLDAFDTARMWKLIHMNILPVTALTKEFVGSMSSNKKGLVVNVGSMSGLLSTPLLSVYSASKAYVHTFTDALRQEYAERNIHFQVICPMFVSTAMTGMRPSRMCPTPDAYARSAVATFGKTAFTCGYWAHSLQTTIYGLVPKFVIDSNQLKVLKKGRARFYRKQEEKKE
ncbi:putative steroid dehydrogenase 4 [Bolinopsis microptera]|uniref:putative steroid dehydrogenase 4 n=1 Tax=Bolinopsis microptera TaxID=2820187 RepID=UPI00307957E6